MSRLLTVGLCLLGLAAPSYAGHYRVGTLVVPTAVEYRLVQPQVVRETVTVEKQDLVREPVLVQRTERVLEYQAPVVGYGAALVQKHLVVAPVVVQKVRVERLHAPAVKVQKVETVERRGLFGRRVIRQTITTK